MATKLKNLKITSTDLVDQGANPDAHIKLFKRKDEFEENTIIKKIINAVTNVFENTKQKEIETILHKEEADVMEIGKSETADEEKIFFNNFESAVNENPVVKNTKSPEIHSEIKKIMGEFEKFKKAKDAEIEELRKSLEIERLTTIAKKYEIIGKKPDELSVKLYELKKAGGTLYDDYVALLDENLSAVEKSGIFNEIGKNTSGFAGIAQKIGIAAMEIQKGINNVNLSSAIVKAWEDNPELALEYEREYIGGVK